MSKEKRLEKKELKRKEEQEYENLVVNYNRVVANELSNRRKEKVAPKDAYVSIQNVNKIYDNLVQAVYDFNLDIKKNEFIVLVGPSGCGKSTTLRMVAGLEEITSGNLFIDGTYANALPPKNRDIAMVFQSYALYPHMSVYDNLAFSMKIRAIDYPVKDENGNYIYELDTKKIAKLEEEISKNKGVLAKYEVNLTQLKENNSNSKNKIKIKYYENEINYLKNDLDKLNSSLKEAKENKIIKTEYKKLNEKEIDEIVQSTAEILQIKECLNRKPKQLSGGQRQRVALGRAICKKAKLFLMDEPLSNLDAKLRVSMRSEIIRIHKAIGATTIYVTHDQTEAMTMADRIVIMNKGYIQQIGTPKEIYNHPANLFVATFIGSPAMNTIDVKIKNNEIVFDEFNKISIPQNIIDSLTNFYKNKINEINEFLENGLKREFEKELNVKKETLRLKLGHSLKRYTLNENNEVIDLVHNVTLDSYEKEICNNLFKEQSEVYLNNKKVYEEDLNNNEFNVTLGIRAEHCLLLNSFNEEDSLKSDTLKLKVTIKELLGNEYFLHSELAHKDFVFKISANHDVNENEEIEVVFDLNKLHLFDKIEGKIII